MEKVWKKGANRHLGKHQWDEQREAVVLASLRVQPLVRLVLLELPERETRAGLVLPRALTLRWGGIQSPTGGPRRGEEEEKQGGGEHKGSGGRTEKRLLGCYWLIRSPFLWRSHLLREARFTLPPLSRAFRF
ncbi:hypothetical protein EYF80_032123 [Liparis tanakae]|uniref:Uncharacterized protein n=1 Tax=Liparis tanakae TaxID=230148 RepID=A0A4Z2GWK2_9TELE|nr:hypothetical protein EYF80_032123 [Liparis tanakae]